MSEKLQTAVKDSIAGAQRSGLKSKGDIAAYVARDPSVRAIARQSDGQLDMAALAQALTQEWACSSLITKRQGPRRVAMVLSAMCASRATSNVRRFHLSVQSAMAVATAHPEKERISARAFAAAPPRHERAPPAFLQPWQFTNVAAFAPTCPSSRTPYQQSGF